MTSVLAGAFHLVLAVQATGATVTGTIRDTDSGVPLPGAVVHLTDVDRVAVADSAGHYMLSDVPAGPQHFSVRLIGYGDRTLHALVPRSGRLVINVLLSAAPIRLAAVEVRPRVPVRGLESDRADPFPDRRLSIAAVRNHPLLNEADVLRALGGAEASLDPEAPRGMHVRGGAADQTAYLLDGVPVFSPLHAGGLFSAWNPDAIAEIALYSSAPSPSLPDVLSGVVAATTRAPGTRLGATGSVSTTQSRVTVDGPIGARGAGYLLSLRAGYPAALAPGDDASHLRGETGDWLAKVEAPLLGGRMRLLGYESENELDAAVRAAEVPLPDNARNTFNWRSRSAGAEWTRPLTDEVRFLARAWSAVFDASTTWSPANAGPVLLDSDRRDVGFLLEIERTGEDRSSTAGIRLERSRTSYRVIGAGDLAIHARTPVASVYARHARPAGRRNTIEMAGSLMATRGELHWGPRVRLAWQPADALGFSASWARLHQFAQSLRNAESVAGMVFPVDLYVGAAASSVPPGNNTQWVLAADYSPAPGVRVHGQVHRVNANGLLLAAPGTVLPFSSGEFAVGTARSRGASLEASAAGSRAGVLASWSWQDVRFAYEDSRYVPDHGVRHAVETGLVLFPSATSSIRVGVAGAFGRRATAVDGAFEWESCNLLDRGCEFGGSPGSDRDALGATTLPDYVRVDVGARKHWHLGILGRDMMVAAFASVTNVLGRENVLTVAVDPATGERSAVEMRPRAPLSVGLDWRF